MPDKKAAKQSPKKVKAVKAKLSKAELVALLSADSDVSTGDVKRVRALSSGLWRRALPSVAWEASLYPV